MRKACVFWLLTGMTLFLPPEVRAGKEVRLTRDGRLKRDPQYIDNGRRIVYVEQASPAVLRIMRFDLQTGRAEPLHKDAANSEFEPAVSRDGRYTAFVQSRGNLSLALVIRDRQRQRDAELKPTGGFCGYCSPRISPDNRFVVFGFAEAGRQQIYRVQIDGTQRRALTDSGGVNNWPDVSPDGRQIVFSSTRDGNYEIYLMRSDGTGLRRVTYSRFQDIRPRFSPDGKRIAFVSSRDGNYELYVINADGSGLRRLTHNEERDDYPAWHPSGRFLLFVGERGGRYDLYRIPLPVQ